MQKRFASLIAKAIKTSLAERKMTYAEVADAITALGLVSRKKKPYTARSIERALRTGGIPAYLLAAICVVLKIKALPIGK